MSVDLAENHLCMIRVILDALEPLDEDMHDIMDRMEAAGEEVGDDQPVRHVVSALLNVAHSYVQQRSAQATSAELALQFVLVVNQIAGDLAQGYLDAGVAPEPLSPMERAQ